MSERRLERLAVMRSGADIAPNSSPPAITTSELTKDFSTVRALDHLTVMVPRGSIFGFLGRNGAGKTTTIRLLLGLQQPSSGSARVLGFDPATDPDEVRRRCGVLLEHSGLLERLSAEDNLEIHGRVCRMPRSIRRVRIQEVLTDIGLWERRDETVRQWSRGMKQRLAIARAMLPRPSLLFLDEPTAGLDPVAARELRETLLRLAGRERVTVFLTTHNLAEAERLCDTVAVVRSGRVLDIGPPDAIGARHARAFLRVRGSGFSANLVQLVSERTDTGDVRVIDGDLRIGLLPETDSSALIAFLVRLGARVMEAERVGTRLEDGVLALFEQAGDTPGQTHGAVDPHGQRRRPA